VVRDNSGICEAERMTKETWTQKLENEGDSGMTRMKETMVDSGNDKHWGQGVIYPVGTWWVHGGF
jgi:hypothetical protein